LFLFFLGFFLVFLFEKSLGVKKKAGGGGGGSYDQRVEDCQID